MDDPEGVSERERGGEGSEEFPGSGFVESAGVMRRVGERGRGRGGKVGEGVEEGGEITARVERRVEVKTGGLLPC